MAGYLYSTRKKVFMIWPETLNIWVYFDSLLSGKFTVVYTQHLVFSPDPRVAYIVPPSGFLNRTTGTIWVTMYT